MALSRFFLPFGAYSETRGAGGGEQRAHAQPVMKRIAPKVASRSSSRAVMPIPMENQA
jgi:hypothetical protein